MTIKIAPEKIVYTIGIIAALLVLANTVGYILKFVPKNPLVNNFTLVNLDLEANLPTYFSSLLLLCSGILLGLVASLKKTRKESYVFHWAFLSFIFVCMSIDEAASVHELLISPLRSLFNVSGIFYHAWIIPGIFFTLTVMLIYARFVIKLPKRTKFIFIAAGAFYVAGVIGMEMIGGKHITLYGRNSLSYGLLTTLEETLEILGLILFIYGLLDYIRGLKMKIEFEFG
jgi:hypothetical protein